jgi:hypothetical protein
MAEPAFVLSSATAFGAAWPSAAAEARRPAIAARPRCRAETPPLQGGTEPETAADATDYTGFSMVGIAG